jgi:hypothetical protein
MLWTFLNVGLTDDSTKDKQWATSIRAMRYTAVVAERLWALLKEERTRVRLLRLLHLSYISLTILHRLIVLKGTCSS